MPMRVIAGTYKHRHLTYPEDDKNIRPTKDRIKEAFFSAIGDVSNKVFLDLCAGTGGMGIEALSRGASFCYFVDNNRKSLSYIKNNIASLNIDNCLIIDKDALESIKIIRNQNKKVDIVYFDPPYESQMYEDVLSYIYNNDLLNDGAIVAFEANKKINLNPVWYSSLREYHYGEITVTVLKKWN